jgi:catechol 2,3-dioxygenase-like lactoylglutathione lyase family enzyme
MQVKATHHIAILTRNFAAMEKFYNATLGFPITKRWDDASIIFLDIGSSTIELIGKDRGPAAGSPPGAFEHIALHVDDVDVAYAELVSKNIPITVEPMNFKEIRICFFKDPDGNLLELVEDPRKEGK